MKVNKLDIFDEMGLMVLEENNLHWWQQNLRTSWKDFKASKEHIKKISTATHRQLRKMIERDRNHPSVIIWSMSNECRPDEPGVLDTIRKSLRIARRLDPSRLATHVSAEWSTSYGEDDFSLDDVICINGYARDKDWWDRELPLLKERYPDKPVVQSEVGSGSQHDAYQAEIISELIDWLGDNPVFSGYTHYSFASVPTLEGKRTGVTSGAYAEKDERPQPSANYGIYSRDRAPRSSAQVIRKFFERKRDEYQ